MQFAKKCEVKSHLQVPNQRRRLVNIYKFLFSYNSMANGTKQIMEKLDEIKSELDEIKEHMLDADVILTEKEKVSLETAEKEYGAGKTISLEEFKKRRSDA